MLGGRIRQVGRSADVYRRPNDRSVAEFLGDANFLPGEARNGFVTCALGRIAASAPSGAVEVMVRPEDLTLSAEGGLPVEVVSREYFGHDQLVTVRLESGCVLMVRLLPSAELEHGQRLGLRLAGEVVVFPRPTLEVGS